MSTKKSEIIKELEHQFSLTCKKYNVDKKIEDELSNHIVLEKINQGKGLIYIDKHQNGHSIKPYNVVLDFKNILNIIIELLLSGVIFTQVDAILAILNFAYQVSKLSVVNIDKVYGKVIIFLQKNNAFDVPMEQEKLEKYVTTLQTDISTQEIIDFLKELKTIKLNDGKITLVERVKLSSKYYPNE